MFFPHEVQRGIGGALEKNIDGRVNPVDELEENCQGDLSNVEYAPGSNRFGCSLAARLQDLTVCRFVCRIPPHPPVTAVVVTWVVVVVVVVAAGMGCAVTGSLPPVSSLSDTYPQPEGRGCVVLFRDGAYVVVVAGGV